ncbi:MAG: response regulator transcription factor [Proteobacteria bacterium]|nr:response regulator transcription factor [Pseudomonadota bacterium]
MSRQIIVADDHPLFREAMKAAVGRLDRGVGFVEADSVAAMLAAAEANPGADLLLLDLNMPGAHGFNALAHVRGSRPELPVVIVSADDDPQTIAASLRFGAQGFIPKSTEAGQIGKAIEAVLAGEIYTPTSGEELEIARRVADLTPQQFRVLGMLCAGLLNKQIAYDLDVSEATVKAHVTAILRKLGVTTRTQAVLAAGRLAVDRASIKPPPEEFD